MTEKRLYHQLRELAWRRKLTAVEQDQLEAWLAAHPEDAADWEIESALNHSLAGLPDAAVPSNFTALVLQEVERQQPRPSSSPVRLWWRWGSWLPRVAVACVLLGLGLFAHQQAQESERRAVVRSVSVLSEVAAVPSPEILKDFEAISVLDRTPPADEELLQLLQ